jgi:hypothetical protein
VLKGYVQGKRDAEARLAQLFPNSGVALRPGFIHGTRNVAGIPVPLQIVGRVPLSPDVPDHAVSLLFHHQRRRLHGARAHLCIC